jgi:hypothetical protein
MEMGFLRSSAEGDLLPKVLPKSFFVKPPPLDLPGAWAVEPEVALPAAEGADPRL